MLRRTVLAAPALLAAPSLRGPHPAAAQPASVAADRGKTSAAVGAEIVPFTISPAWVRAR